MGKPVKVGITHGDYNGVGYEVILKALADPAITELCTPVIFAIPELFERACEQFDIHPTNVEMVRNPREARDGMINIVDLGVRNPKLEAGLPTPDSGKAAVKALDMATQALKDQTIDVLVTAPISKKAVQSETFKFPGHTEYLEAVIGDGRHAQMILFDDNLRMALVTTHLPISKVPEAVTEERVLEGLRTFNDVLRRDFRVERPKIAVLSLNPHCGDNGLLGNEEIERIIPAINAAKEEYILAFGPYSADGFFATGAFKDYDGVLAMYHDQGLAPFKAIAAEAGVNFTAGLPYVRTSPDHGTAYDIAWKGFADPTSMRQAIYRAIDIFRYRHEYEKAARNPLRKARMTREPDRTIDLTEDTDKL